MESIFLACFVFGALFTVASIVLGFAGHGAAHIGHSLGHLGGNAHVGQGAAHIGHGGLDSAHVPAGHGGPDSAHVHAGHGVDQAHGVHSEVPHSENTTLPWLNASSAVGALTWFGAAGYLMLRLGDWAVPAVLIGALLAAGVGWYLVARFLGLVLAGEREMDPEDYRLEGTVGQVTVSIPPGGTGEVVFAKAGARRSEAARAMGGGPIPRGSEVVITTYADGFATVQPWGEFLAARDKLAVPKNREA
jgi:membrane protein implicated in regulation of membrane protease activity